MKTIDVIGDKFELPPDVKYPVTVRLPFSTQRIYKSDKFGRRTIQMWFKKKRQLPDDEIEINGERYKVRRITSLGEVE